MNLTNRSFAFALASALGLAMPVFAQGSPTPEAEPPTPPEMTAAVLKDGSVQLSADNLGDLAHVVFIASAVPATITVPEPIGLTLLLPHVVLADFNVSGANSISTKPFSREDILLEQVHLQVVGISADGRFAASPILVIKGGLSTVPAVG